MAVNLLVLLLFIDLLLINIFDSNKYLGTLLLRYCHQDCDQLLQLYCS